MLPSGVASPKPDSYEGLASGDYHESVPIEVPGFRGLEPDISLDYSSGQLLRYGPDGNGWLGRGWSLSGVPAIERISRGGGAPRFDSTDTYSLGDDELIACVSGVTSPSCATGGTHATLVESYQRIKFDTAANVWTVWQRDGTRYEFRAVAETSPPPSDPIIQQLANNYRWLLRRAIDTHNNVVTYSYLCEQYVSCRIDKINYSSAEIKFRWANRPDPIAYATGLNRLTSTQRLKTIQVQFAGANVRAYALGYDQSAITGSSRVTSIQQFGSDATVAGDGTVTAGATPPLPARLYTYRNNLTVGTTTKLCESSTGSGPVFVVDNNGDLKDQIRYPSGCTPTAAGLPFAGSFPPGTPGVFAGGNGGTTGAGSPIVTTDYRMRGLADFSDDNINDSFGDVVTIQTYPAGEVYWFTSGSFIIVPPSTTKQTGTLGKFIGDVNGDGRDDSINGASVVLGNATGLGPGSIWSNQPASGPCDLLTTTCGFAYKAVSDINGDGKGDLIGFFDRGVSVLPRYTLGWRLSNGSSWANQEDNPNFIAGSVGDFDGDGKSDLVAYSQTPYMPWMLYSNGSGFEVTTMPANGGGGIDFNGDGRTDTIEGFTASSHINFSSGTGFLVGPTLSTMPAGSSKGGYADLAGDGLPDIITTTTSGSQFAVYATEISGTIPDLMLTAKNVFGGTTSITYRPSADFVNTMSFIKPVVSTVTVNDGINPAATTTLSYSGGKYDAIERMFLGFASVTIDKPCNTGETACPRTNVSYRQDFAAVGMPYFIQDLHPSGYTLRSNYEGFTVNNTTAPFTALDTTTIETIGDGTSTRQRQTNRTFDSYGQVNKIADLGAMDWTSDERTTVLTRYPKTSAYIVDRVAVEAIKTGDETGPNIRYTETRYDGATSTSTPPTKGDPTAVIGYTTLITSTVKYGYDSVGNRTSVTDPTNNVTSTTYDATYALFPVTTTNALSQTTTRAFSVGCAAPTSSTDPNGLVTTFTYDAHCRQKGRIDPDYNWLAISYNNLGTPNLQHILIERPSTNGNLWEQRYLDGAGRVFWMNRRGAGSNDISSWVRYSQRGAIAEYVKPYINTGGTQYATEFVQDVLDRTVKATLADGRVRTTTYGLATAATRPFDKVQVYDELGRTTQTQRDAFGRTVATSEYIGSTSYVTRAFYDVMGQVTSITDPAGNEWSYVYDTLGRRTNADDPDRGAWSYAYDAAGRLTLETDALGQKTAFSYDALGRVLTTTTRQGLAGAETTTNTYDQVRSGFYNKGYLTTAANPVATITYDQDKGGRLAKRTWTVAGLAGTKTETTAYDGSGQVLWRGWPDGTTTGTAASPWTYDTAGRLYSVTGIISWTDYNAADQVRQIQYANGIRTDNYYDGARDWLTDIFAMVGTSTTAVMIQNYTRDAAGRITRWVVGPSATDDTVYTYDSLDRITKTVNSATGITRTYAFNLAGSMTSNSAIGSYVYPAQGATAVRPHAPVSVAATSNSYDANGSLLSDGSRTYSYDGANRLALVTLADGTVSYAYGPDGDHIQTISLVGSGTGTTTTWLGDTTITNAGTTIKAPHPDVRKVGGATCYVHRDHLGSIRVETDAWQALMLRLRYATFGSRILTYQGANCTDENRAFVGERVDTDVDLMDLNARWYNPATALFLTADNLDPIDTAQARAGSPIGWLANPVGTNRYAYAGQDPVNKRDPGGHAIDRSADTAKALAMLGGAPTESMHRASRSLLEHRTETYPASSAGQRLKEGTDSRHDSMDLFERANMQWEPWWAIGTPCVCGIGFPFVGGGGGGRAPAPDFIVTPRGTALPVPKGAVGPSPNIVPGSGKGTGTRFEGGTMGPGGKVKALRLMDPVAPRGRSPGYPNGYAVYENSTGQTVNPLTGQTIPRTDPFAHIPLD